MSKPVPSYRNSTPAQNLGQYQSWALSTDSHVMDKLWISIAGQERSAHHRVLPHGEPSLSILRRYDHDGAISCIGLKICRADMRPHWYRPQPREDIISVQLLPEYSAHICGFLPADIHDGMPNMLDAPHAMRTHFTSTLKIAETGTPHDIAAALVRELGAFSCHQYVKDTPENTALHILRQTGGRMRTQSLAKRLDVSERHLRRRFRSITGHSPKSYARMLRVTGTALMAENLDHPDWAQIAYGAGYYDQAHMINDFKGIIGLTPQDLHRERRALAVFCNN